jgi:hypothetical protein
MPVVVYRQPWFWGLIVALCALLVFGVVSLASNSNREEPQSTTIVQQPAPPPAPSPSSPAIIPVPGPSVSSIPPAPPVRPVEPARPAEPKSATGSGLPTIIKQVPQIIKEKTVVIREKAPAKPDSSNSSPNGLSPSGPASGAPSLFQDTGLPKEFRFEDGRWRAMGTVTIADSSTLQSAGTSDDGQALWARSTATEPYTTLLVQVPEEMGRYVQYRKQ